MNGLSKMSRLSSQKVESEPKSPCPYNFLGESCYSSFLHDEQPGREHAAVGILITVLHQRKKTNFSESDLSDFEKGLHNAISSVLPDPRPLLGATSMPFQTGSVRLSGPSWQLSRRRTWREKERLSSIVDDFDDHDPMDYLHCIGKMQCTS